MNPIDQAILQDEIRQAINALFKTGQVGREENAALLDVVGNGEHFDHPGWANTDGSPVPFTPEVGKEYSVTLTTPSGTATFKTVASELDGIAVIGNPALMGAPNDTGEIFACATLNNQFFCVWDVINFEPNEVRVQIKSETIHPIDPKFLPGVCLPVVELETVLTADAVLLTAKEEKQLAIASANSKYTLVALVPPMAISPILCTWFEEDGDAMLIGHFYDVIAKGMKQLCLFYAEGNCVGQVTDINV